MRRFEFIGLVEAAEGSEPARDEEESGFAGACAAEAWEDVEGHLADVEGAVLDQALAGEEDVERGFGEAEDGPEAAGGAGPGALDGDFAFFGEDAELPAEVAEDGADAAGVVEGFPGVEDEGRAGAVPQGAGPLVGQGEVEGGVDGHVKLEGLVFEHGWGGQNWFLCVFFTTTTGQNCFFSRCYAFTILSRFCFTLAVALRVSTTRCECLTIQG